MSVNEVSWYKFRLSDPDQSVAYTGRRAALGMLLYVIAPRVVNLAHRLLHTISYPLAYSLVVLPLSVSRWLLFGNHSVPSAATFFSVTMFNLSGAINVLLFLIVRPHLLLFTRRAKLAEPEMEILPQGSGQAIFSDIATFQQSPEPTSAALPDEGSIKSAAKPHVSPRRISDDI